MATSFDNATEVEEIITKLVSKEEEFRYLQNGTIIARFRTGSWKSAGKSIYGKTKVLSPFERYELNAEILILVNKQMWPLLDERQKEALIFHNLCHVEVPLDSEGAPKVNKQDGRPIFKMKSHDLEEFRLVVEKYGLWMPDTKDFMNSVKKGEQLAFDLEVPSNDRGKIIHLHLHAAK